MTSRPSPHHGRVAVAMSGGVDSSVAAALLTEQGYEVVGIHMKLHDLPDEQRRDKSCCSIDDAMDARQACARLGIPFYVVDFTQSFRESVIDYFVSAYRAGQTPNPCVMCNQRVKSQVLLNHVREFGCEKLATGHYARVRKNPDSGGFELLRPRDRKKDQTYFLFGTLREELPNLLFPLADHEKTETRSMAEKHGFFTWNKPDSQEVCFVPEDYRDFLSQQFQELPPPGDFVDHTGKILGRHKGLPYYTVGQRRGLGIGAAEPLYVVALRPERNEVVLGGDSALYSGSMRVDDVNWVSCPPIRGAIEAEVKVRYAHAGTRARIIPQDGDRQVRTVRVEFLSPVRAVAPGQAAVFYQGEVVLGGGWIQTGTG